MTTTTLSLTAPPALDLDARLALTDAIMGARLDQAAIAFEVRTAHIPSADPTPTITAAPPEPCPYTTPLARLLHHARIRLTTHGWCTDALRDEQGATCLMGALRATAHSRHHADDAMQLLLEAIRRDYPSTPSVPAWNDRHATPHLAARYLDRAAELAHARGA
jgi:hypothetical protein